MRLDQEPTPDNLRAVFEDVRRRHQSGELSKTEIVLTLKRAIKAQLTGQYLCARLQGQSHEAALQEAIQASMPLFAKVEKLEENET